MGILPFIERPIYKKKAPMYVPYIMKLILQKETTCPFLVLIFFSQGHEASKEGSQVGKCKCGDSGSRAPFASNDDENVLDARRRPCMNNASNTPIGDGWTAPSRDEMMTSVKKASVFEKMLLCMNIDIRKSQYASYRTKRRIDHNQHVLMDKVVQFFPPDQRPHAFPEPTTKSEGTLYLTTWNQGVLVKWKELEEITSGPSRCPWTKMMRTTRLVVPAVPVGLWE
jgi:hypothetical protein